MLFKTIRLSLLLTLSLFIMTGLQAQEDKSKRPSPPATSEAKIGIANIKVDYSSPAVKGRTIWGDLVTYGELWRTGANEATVFETSADLIIEGQALPAGRYALFTIPNADSWTIIFNSESDQWGAYRYKESKDVLRVNVKPQANPSFAERFTIDVNKSDTGGSVSIKWADQMAAFNIAG